MSTIEYLATFDLSDGGDDVSSLIRMRFLRFLHVECYRPSDGLLTRFTEAIPMIEWLSCSNRSCPYIVYGANTEQAKVCKFKWSRHFGSNKLCRSSYHIESNLSPNSAAYAILMVGSRWITNFTGEKYRCRSKYWRCWQILVRL